MNNQDTHSLEHADYSDGGSMLTTVDNPFNPFTHFDEWKTWDEAHGYYTSEYLARIVCTSDELSDVDEALAIEQGIDEIVRLNILGIYKKVRQ